MNSCEQPSYIESLEPRLLLDGGWAVGYFAQWYGGGNEAYGPDSDLVVRTTGTGD